jgi:hypothetical protein
MATFFYSPLSLTVGSRVVDSDFQITLQMLEKILNHYYSCLMGQELFDRKKPK